MDSDEFDEAMQRDSRPEPWVKAFERVWAEVGYEGDDVHDPADPIDRWLMDAREMLGRLAGVVSLRLDTHYLADEAYLGGDGVERLRAAVAAMWEARRHVTAAIGEERAVELTMADNAKVLDELGIEWPALDEDNDPDPGE